MKPPVLILDCHYLCYRALYSTGSLSHHDSKTGVVYGLLRELVSLKDQFNTTNMLFCFDKGKSKRYQLYPQYKAGRHAEKTEEEKQARREFKRQISLLRKIYLPAIGFKNIFAQDGYEADDLIASLCLMPKVRRRKVIIVSSDEDLFQCLTKNISMWIPIKKKLITDKTVLEERGIECKKWHLVKAIAGCSSDNIKGVPGVGEKTAIKYLNNELNVTTKAYKAIMNSSFAIPLTTLPMPGLKPLKLRNNKFSQTGWNKVLRTLGIESMKGKNPFIRKDK